MKTPDYSSSYPQTVMAQARAQGVPEVKVQLLQQQLSGLMGQATALVQQGNAQGGIQIPTQALQALSANMQGAASGMSAQGMSAQGLPGVPAFLGTGGLDTIIDYLINGLGTAVSLIPFIGGPLSEIIKQVGGSLKDFLINNALAGGVANALTQAQTYYKQLQDLLGYADVNKLLGAGSTIVSDRLNGFLLDNTKAPIGGAVKGGQTKTEEIAAAIKAAQDINGQNLKDDLSLANQDKYKDATGFSKYTNPLNAVSDIAGMIAKMQAARSNSKMIAAAGQSVTALAAADTIASQAAANVGEVMTQGEIAKAGTSAATTALGAITMQTSVMTSANNLNAMNAARTAELLKQQIMVGDANLQATTELVQHNVEEQRGRAQAMNSAQEEVQANTIDTANSAAAAVASLRNMPQITTLNAADHPMPGPYGEGSIFP